MMAIGMKNQNAVNNSLKRNRIEGDEAMSSSCKINKVEILKINARKETDQKKLESRFKQIKFGKNTLGYDNYIEKVPKHKRKNFAEHPRTPDPYELQSKRSFDGRIKVWRRELHKWDPASIVDELQKNACHNTLENVLNIKLETRSTPAMSFSGALVNEMNSKNAQSCSAPIAYEGIDAAEVVDEEEDISDVL